MMRMPRVLIIAWVALCGLSSAGRAELVNGIRAVVYEAVITQGEVDADAALVAGELQRQYRRQPEIFEKKINEALAESLDRALQRQLILRDYVASGYQMPDSIIDEVVKERIQNEFGGNRADLTKTLQARGITYEQFKKQTRDRFIISQLQAKNIYQELIISPNKLEAYYLNHPDEFQGGGSGQVADDRVKQGHRSGGGNRSGPWPAKSAPRSSKGRRSRRWPRSTPTVRNATRGAIGAGSSGGFCAKNWRGRRSRSNPGN